MEVFILGDISFRLINTLRGEDSLDYEKLHNLLFPGMAIDSKWVNWYHHQLYNTRTYGAYDTDEDKLIGIWSIESRRLYISSHILSIGRCFAVGIHPDYRRRGLFVELSKYALNCEKQLKQFDYVVGFPQVGREVVGGHFKAGWYPVQNIISYCIKNKTIDKKKLKDFSIIRLDAFRAVDYTKCFQGAFIESPATKDLRWLEHPDHAYVTLKCRKDSFIILKPYKNICHILDVQGTETFSLLNVAKKLCKMHNWEALTIWCADNEMYRSDIIDAEFLPSEEYMKSVQMIAYNINAKENLKLDTCHLQTGIEEPY